MFHVSVALRQTGTTSRGRHCHRHGPVRHRQLKLAETVQKKNEKIGCSVLKLFEATSLINLNMFSGCHWLQWHLVLLQGTESYSGTSSTVSLSSQSMVAGSTTRLTCESWCHIWGSSSTQMS